VTVEGRFGKFKASKGEILLFFFSCMVSLKGSYMLVDAKIEIFYMEQLERLKGKEVCHCED
jgi:hypothetical protein